MKADTGPADFVRRAVGVPASAANPERAALLELLMHYFSKTDDTRPVSSAIYEVDDVHGKVRAVAEGVLSSVTALLTDGQLDLPGTNQTRLKDVIPYLVDYVREADREAGRETDSAVIVDLSTVAITRVVSLMNDRPDLKTDLTTDGSAG